MIIILDSVLNPTTFSNFKSTIDNFHGEAKWFYKDEAETYSDTLLQIASEYFNFNELVGFEVWTHNSTIPIGDNDDGWHKDRDELSYHVRKLFRFPVCSIVFYVKVKELEGGELIIEDTIITPKENRLVIFGPGLIHRVNEFEGERISFSINPWNRKLDKYS
jgi:hypothetical protein